MKARVQPPGLGAPCLGRRLRAAGPGLSRKSLMLACVQASSSLGPSLLPNTEENLDPRRAHPFRASAHASSFLLPRNPDTLDCLIKPRPFSFPRPARLQEAPSVSSLSYSPKLDQATCRVTKSVRPANSEHPLPCVRHSLGSRERKRREGRKEGREGGREGGRKREREGGRERGIHRPEES